MCPTEPIWKSAPINRVNCLHSDNAKINLPSKIFELKTSRARAIHRITSSRGHENKKKTYALVTLDLTFVRKPFTRAFTFKYEKYDNERYFNDKSSGAGENLARLE